MKLSYFVFYEISLIVSIVALLVIILMLFRRRKVNGVTAIISLCTGLLIWTSGYLIQTVCTTLESQNLVDDISLLGLMIVPSSWVIFASNYNLGSTLLRQKNIVPFFIFPLMIFIILRIPELRHFMWQTEILTEAEGFYTITRTFGPVFWIFAFYNYSLIIAGIVILLWRLYGSRLYLQQAISIITAVLIPIGANIAYIFDLLPMHKDLTPVFFTLSVFMVFFGMYHFDLFKVIPFANKSLIYQMKDAIIAFDRSNNLIDANKKSRELFSLNYGDIGKHVDTIPTFPESIKELLQSRNGEKEISYTKTDAEYFLEVETIQLTDSRNNETGLVIILRDITEQKRIRELMLAQDRLASIGLLTAGIAHEINNPLAIIKGVIELTLTADVSEETKSDLAIANEELDRASNIIKNLLTFARNQSSGKTSIDVNSLIEKTLEMRNYQQKQNNINTITHFTPGISGIWGSETQLRQVLVNLIINAEYFVSENDGMGTIDIRTFEKTDSVRISIRDNGPGIAEEKKKLIFDPFYTSKDIGEGTGLGLSICYGIIQDHEGTIEVESNVGEGTTFTISLPVYKPESVIAPEKS